ncbi:ABC transporter permease [Actibacterium sp. XHP0104]|uniref:ABC transporter permease n=1 Tax=Actibacterium sp. XHP0104 TaxID=2984335 RepID=UPI0021E8EF5E|nr:ABC transporter permease [Actibacterium sp. XHP0104]MCV2880639.1 ABC transporter permease [Actibacterium sp. XHP0104]
MRLAPLLTLLFLAGPVLAGLAGVVAPALGYFPAIGANDWGLGAFRALFDWPGISTAIRLSVTTGLAATAIALAVTVLILAAWSGTRTFRWIERALSPLLSVPHAAAAFGIAFLIAPSGWIVRAISPWLTGWTRPPDLLILQDPLGIAMVLGLVAKEVPFLLLMALAALPQCQPSRSLTVAQSMGYGRVTGWLKAVLPRLYPLIRLPVYAVLAYSMSVVDVAIILGPNTPPPLSVQVVRWMSQPDLTLRLTAAAGALLQTGLVVGALITWRLAEMALARAGRRWATGGARSNGDPALRVLAMALAALSAAAIFAGLAGLGLWSITSVWRFPQALPDALTLSHWARHGPMVLPTLADTVLIAASATLAALVLVIACLETEIRLRLRLEGRALWLLYLPLIIPQIAFLPGLQTLALNWGADMGRVAVTLVHLVFVLPYVMLSLADPYHGWDARQATVAAALGASPRRIFWRLRLSMLLAPALTAAAVGFAVSVGQYLPTLLIGGGRVQTLTTEAVALAAGGDRRVIGIYALAQTGVVVLGFAAAIGLPRLVWANRRGLRGAA